MSRKIAVVLSGGGARGAYQVGVLKGLSEILQKNIIKPDIRIFCGVSAGAINAAYLAAEANDFHKGVDHLVELWSNMQSTQVFASDAVHMGKIAVTWASELSLGALTGATPNRALLDTSPLRKLIETNLITERIHKNIQEGHFEALALTAVDYATSNSITFVEGRPGLPVWNKSRRRSEKTKIGAEHVMASSAIPLLFPSVPVGPRWFGDGCVRNAQPCSPAIYLGADRLLVVGVRQRGSISESDTRPHNDRPPSVARVMNLLLNAVLLDGVELDVERLERVNEFVRRVPEEHRGQLNFREVEYAMVAPSADIGVLAAAKSSRLPRIIRYLLKGLGSVDDAAEIVSYLLFDPSFCSQLIVEGRQDAWKSESELVHLFRP